MSCTPRPAIIPGDEYHVDLFNKKDHAGTWTRQLESSGLIEKSPGSYIPWRHVPKRQLDDPCTPLKPLIDRDPCCITKNMEEAGKLYNMRTYRPGCMYIDTCTKKVRQSYCWPDDGSLIPFAKPCRCLPPTCKEGTPYTVPSPLKVRRPHLFEWHCGTAKPMFAFVEYPKEADKANKFGNTIMRYVPLDTVANLRHKAKAEALYSAMWKFPKCGADGPPRRIQPDCIPGEMYTCKTAFPDAKPCPFYPMTLEEAEKRGLCHPCGCS